MGDVSKKPLGRRDMMIQAFEGLSNQPKTFYSHGVMNVEQPRIAVEGMSQHVSLPFQEFEVEGLKMAAAEPALDGKATRNELGMYEINAGSIRFLDSSRRCAKRYDWITEEGTADESSCSTDLEDDWSKQVGSYINVAMDKLEYPDHITSNVTWWFRRLLLCEPGHPLKFRSSASSLDGVDKHRLVTFIVFVSSIDEQCEAVFHGEGRKSETVPMRPGRFQYFAAARNTEMSFTPVRNGWRVGLEYAVKFCGTSMPLFHTVSSALSSVQAAMAMPDDIGSIMYSFPLDHDSTIDRLCWRDSTIVDCLERTEDRNGGPCFVVTTAIIKSRNTSNIFETSSEDEKESSQRHPERIRVLQWKGVDGRNISSGTINLDFNTGLLPLHTGISATKETNPMTALRLANSSVDRAYALVLPLDNLGYFIKAQEKLRSVQLEFLVSVLAFLRENQDSSVAVISTIRSQLPNLPSVCSEPHDEADFGAAVLETIAWHQILSDHLAPFLEAFSSRLRLSNRGLLVTKLKDIASIHKSKPIHHALFWWIRQSALYGSRDTLYGAGRLIVALADPTWRREASRRAVEGVLMRIQSGIFSGARSESLVPILSLLSVAKFDQIADVVTIIDHLSTGHLMDTPDLAKACVVMMVQLDDYRIVKVMCDWFRTTYSGHTNEKGGSFREFAQLCICNRHRFHKYYCVFEKCLIQGRNDHFEFRMLCVLMMMYAEDDELFGSLESFLPVVFVSWGFADESLVEVICTKTLYPSNLKDARFKPLISFLQHAKRVRDPSDYDCIRNTCWTYLKSKYEIHFRVEPCAGLVGLALMFVGHSSLTRLLVNDILSDASPSRLEKWIELLGGRHVDDCEIRKIYTRRLEIVKANSIWKFPEKHIKKYRDKSATHDTKRVSQFLGEKAREVCLTGFASIQEAQELADSLPEGLGLKATAEEYGTIFLSIEKDRATMERIQEEEWPIKTKEEEQLEAWLREEKRPIAPTFAKRQTVKISPDICDFRTWRRKKAPRIRWR